tara:strand:+ start:2448 stop:3509 length:1062 start_codon:yes stop_codon:yes gene_type:complete
MKNIKIGILGCGRVAQHYKNILNSGNVKNFEIVGVADKEISKAQNYSKNFNCDFFSDLSEMINKKKPNLVLVLTPSGEHFNDVRKSLKMGCNTIVEKPIAMTPSEADSLKDLSIKMNLMLGVVYQNRLNPAIQFLKNELNKGVFGKIITASIRLRWARYQDYYEDEWHGTWKQDGGVINQQAIHHVDVMNWLCGPVTEVCATGGNLINNLEAEDTMVGIIKFKNGSFGTIEATTGLRPKDQEASISIVGDKAIATVGGIALNKIEKWYSNNSNQNEKEIINKFSQEVPNGYGLSHGPYLQKVIDCLNNGSIDAPVNSEDAAITTRIIHSLYASYENNSWISINDKINSQKLGI